MAVQVHTYYLIKIGGSVLAPERLLLRGTK